MAKLTRRIVTRMPLPDGICPGCGSFRRGQSHYCDRCVAQAQSAPSATAAVPSVQEETYA